MSRFLNIATLVVFITNGFCLTANARSVVPPFEKLTTKNGITVYYFQSPNIPLFEVHMVFDGGSDWDPKGLSGAGLFAASMMKRGVPGLDEDAIARKLDDVAGGVEASIDDERLTVSSFGLNAHAREINHLMFEQLGRPTFPSKPFERMKRNHLETLSKIPESAAAMASHALESLLFNGTVKARPGSGLRSDIRRIQLSDLKKQYPYLVRTDRLKVLVVGGKDHSEVLDDVVQGLENLPCTECGRQLPLLQKWDFPNWKVPGGNVLLVKRPGISEAHVRMGFIGPKRKIPEFYDLRVAETILSGHFSSRLNLIIREKLNLTYGISANFEFGDSIGTFIVTTSTRNEKVGDLLVQINKLLGNFVEGEISGADVQGAKDYLVGSFPLGLQNMYTVANSFFNGVVNGLNPTFIDDFQEKINLVSVASLKAAVKKYFLLDQMKTVVVGDKKSVGEVLRKKNIQFIEQDPKVFL